MNKLKSFLTILIITFIFIFVAFVTYNLAEPKAYDFMTKNVERLEKRMEELRESLELHKENPGSGFEEVKSVEMLIKFEIYLNDAEIGITDGIYLYMNEDGQIVNAEYFVKEDGDVTIISFTDEQLEVIVELFADVFTVNVE